MCSTLTNDLPFDRDGNSNGYFDFVFVHLKLGFDSLDLGSDDGVGAVEYLGMKP